MTALFFLAGEKAVVCDLKALCFMSGFHETENMV